MVVFFITCTNALIKLRANKKPENHKGAPEPAGSPHFNHPRVWQVCSSRRGMFQALCLHFTCCFSGRNERCRSLCININLDGKILKLKIYLFFHVVDTFCLHGLKAHFQTHFPLGCVYLCLKTAPHSWELWRLFHNPLAV